jgi:hypothetical protein
MRDGVSRQATLRVLRTLIEAAESEGATHLSVAALKEVVTKMRVKP